MRDIAARLEASADRHYARAWRAHHAKDYARYWREVDRSVRLDRLDPGRPEYDAEFNGQLRRLLTRGRLEERIEEVGRVEEGTARAGGRAGA